MIGILSAVVLGQTTYTHWRLHVTERFGGPGSVCTAAVRLYDGDTLHDTSDLSQSSASGTYGNVGQSSNFGYGNPWNVNNWMDWCSESDSGTQDSYIQYQFPSGVQVTKYGVGSTAADNTCKRPPQSLSCTRGRAAALALVCALTPQYRMAMAMARAITR